MHQNMITWQLLQTNEQTTNTTNLMHIALAVVGKSNATVAPGTTSWQSVQYASCWVSLLYVMTDAQLVSHGSRKNQPYSLRATVQQTLCSPMIMAANGESL